MDELAPGTEIGAFRVERRLGGGAFAAVYLARHRSLLSLHALKVLSPALVASADIRERFLAEARIQAQLQHPHVVRVTDLISEPGVAALVMEYVEGPTLDELLRATPDGLDPAELGACLLPVLDAMHHAHERGLVHRDLKPANILVARDHRGRPRPVVIDFGVAHQRHDAQFVGRRSAPTEIGTRIGTPGYMSPEQTRGGAVDARSDVFSLGAVLFEAATGRLAFDGANDFDVQVAVVEGRVAPLPAAVPPALAAVIRRALAVDPAARFPDCRAFHDALADALSPPASAPAPSRATDGATPASGDEGTAWPPAGPSASGADAKAPTAPAPPRVIRRCVRCGKTKLRDAPICPSCRTPQYPPPEDAAREGVTCPTCDAMNWRGAPWCWACEAPLPSPTPAPRRRLAPFALLAACALAGAAAIAMLDPAPRPTTPPGSTPTPAPPTAPAAPAPSAAPSAPPPAPPAAPAPAPSSRARTQPNGPSAVKPPAPPAPAGRVTGADPILLGPLDVATWRGAVAPALPAIEACYRQGLSRKPAMAGKVSLRLTVGSDGRAGTPTVKSSTLGDAAVADCAARAVDGLRVTAPRPETVLVVWPLTFTPG